jgi:hypothetical protein
MSLYNRKELRYERHLCLWRQMIQAIHGSQELVEQEVQAIKLYAGFGQVGVAKVTQAVGDKAVIGAVRFDRHPGLEFKSGDEIFDEK